MEAIEFITKQKDGIIEIPKKYLKNLKDEFRVIILINAEYAAEKTKNRPSFRALEIETKGFKFDRDKANRR